MSLTSVGSQRKRDSDKGKARRWRLPAGLQQRLQNLWFLSLCWHGDTFLEGWWSFSGEAQTPPTTQQLPYKCLCATCRFSGSTVFGGLCRLRVDCRVSYSAGTLWRSAECCARCTVSVSQWQLSRRWNYRSCVLHFQGCTALLHSQSHLSLTPLTSFQFHFSLV